MSVALVERTGFEVDALDAFCGFGGSSQGIHKAGATVRVAANHSHLALDCHARNFPETEHWQADMAGPSDPQVLDRSGKLVPGRYLDPATLPAARFAWFSPSCTHHSQANAKKIYARGIQAALFEDPEWDQQRYANSERSRVTMSCVLKYAAARHPEIVVVENVVEVTKWGPGGDGSTFRWWLGELDKIGYGNHLCWFNSMFFPPCPQSRDRLYVVAWRKGNTAPALDYRPTAYCTSQQCGGRIVEAVQTWKRPTGAWVTETWGKYQRQYDYRCPVCSSVVHPAAWPALSAIDWSDLGPTLGERIAAGKRPAENTWERIRRAMEKYRNGPFVVLRPGTASAAQVEVAHTEAHASERGLPAGHRVRSVAERLPTLAQRNTVGVVALGVTVKNNGAFDEAGYRGHHVSEPLGSLTAHPAQSVAALAGDQGPRRAQPRARRPDPAALEAVVLPAAGNTSERPGQTRARPAVAPLFPATTAELALATVPVLRGDHFQEHSAAGPACTVPAGGGRGGGHHGVVIPWVEHWQSDPVSVTEQVATITARLRHALASIEPSEEPVSDDLMLAVRFRMLQPDPELRRAMAFADDYILIGNLVQMTAGLGNAVTPPVAAWITERCLATLR